MTLTQYTAGQKYAFSPAGSMESSQLYIDTVVKTNLKIVGKTVFSYLDSSYIDTLNVRQFFFKKYDLLLQDTSECFIVANLTSKPINFKRLNSHLVAEEFSRYKNLGFRPISFFIYPSCGTGFDDQDLVVKPSEILVIKSITARKTSKSKGQPNCFMRLLTSSNVPLVSAYYTKAINNNIFFLKSELERDFNYITPRLAFSSK